MYYSNYTIEVFKNAVMGEGGCCNSFALPMPTISVLDYVYKYVMVPHVSPFSIGVIVMACVK